MIISVDGYDGTGKTTLCENIALNRGFYYVEKPFILKYQFEHKCSLEEAIIKTSLEEKQLYSLGDIKKIINYYCEGIMWLQRFQQNLDIILDRGILTTYAVFGTRENEQEFIKYLKKGISYDLSIYLVADDIERRRRIILNDPNDPDLKYPIKWRENNLEEFAQEQAIDYVKIITDELSPEEVLKIALSSIDSRLNIPKSKQSQKKLIKRLRGDSNEVFNN